MISLADRLFAFPLLFSLPLTLFLSLCTAVDQTNAPPLSRLCDYVSTSQTKKKKQPTKNCQIQINAKAIRPTDRAGGKRGRVWDILPSEALKANAELDLDASTGPHSAHFNLPCPSPVSHFGVPLSRNIVAADKCALVLVV